MYHWDKVDEALRYIERRSAIRPQACLLYTSDAADEL